MFYKNVSASAKTFYGVTFKPGEIKEVPGFINVLYMIRVNGPIEDLKAKPKVVDKKEEKKEEKKASEAAPASDSTVEASGKADTSTNK